MAQIADHLNGLLTFAGLATLGSTAYKFWVPAPVHARHHEALRRGLGWLATTDFLKYLQEGVAFALRLLTTIYGPVGSEGPWPRRFLTLTAWRMSAWIAMLYLLVLGPLVLAGGHVVMVVTGHAPQAAPRLIYAAALAVFAGLVLALLLKSLAPLRAAYPARGWREFQEPFTKGVGQLVLALWPAGLLLFVTILNGGSSSLVLSAIFIGLVVVLSITGLVRAIVVHGVFAPAMLLAQCLVGIPLVWAIINFLSFSSILIRQGVPWSGLFSLVGLTAVVMLATGLTTILFSLSVMAPGRLRRHAFALMIASLAGLALSVTIEMVVAHELSAAFRAALYFLSVGVAPVVIAGYGLIFANSLPDWISVGLTRFVLANARETRSLAWFVAWLLASLAVAVLCLAMTLAILTAAAGLCAWLIGEVAPRIDMRSGAVTGGGVLFLQGAAALKDAVAVFLSSGPDAAAGFIARAWSGHDSANRGFQTLIALSTFGCAAILPALVNALAMAALVIGRIGALILGPVVRMLHGLLVIPETATADERKISYGRSAAIFGLAGALAYLVAYAVLQRL